MNLITAFFGVAEQAIEFFNSKEKRRYQDQLAALKQDWYAEFNKEESTRSDARLDNIERKLCILLVTITTDFRVENSKNMQKP